MDLQIAKDNDRDTWDEIVLQSPHGTIFHRWDWLKSIETHTGSRLVALIGYDGKNPQGLIPLFIRRTGFLTQVFSPPPGSSLLFLGPVIHGWDTLIQSKRESTYFGFQQEVETYLRTEIRADYISVSLPPDFLDIRPYFWGGYQIEVLYDYFTPMSRTMEESWTNLPKKMRANINKSKKMGYHVEMGGKTELREIYRLMTQRYRDQGKEETIPEKYLMDVYDRFTDNFRIFTVKYQDETITGEIDLQFRKNLISWIGSPKPSKPISPSPNDLCEWEALAYTHTQGLHGYVIHGAARNERLHSYYAKINPELHPRFSVKKMTRIAGVLEKAYTRILKPIHGRIR